MGGRPTTFTVNGHPLPQVVSALQKSIRRGKLDDAIYWAVDMDLSNFGAYLWRRLRYIASEDVGLGQPGIAADVRACYENWLEYTKQGRDARLFTIHAVIALTLATKSRLVDWALIAHYGAHDMKRREIPDYALDQHTAQGKRMGRGTDHFVDEGSKLAPTMGYSVPMEEILADEKEYREMARELGHQGVKPAEPPAKAHQTTLGEDEE